MPVPPYITRFAPSPSGPLHFGSLVAALGSYLQARARQGRWLLRIEDVDEPRTIAGADTDIRTALEACAMHWDGTVTCQSQRKQRYAEEFQRLRELGEVFACGCTRKEVAGGIYPGTCHDGLPPGRTARTWRMRVTTQRITLYDAVYGAYAQQLDTEVGDFIIKRADGLFAYQLAVVVDDFDQGITEVVRGHDLLDSTPRQIWLQQRLGYPTPGYLHLPVVRGPGGEKLSKQTGAPGLDIEHASADVHAALAFLGQQPPPALRGASPAEQLDWAIAHWSVDKIPASC